MKIVPPPPVQGVTTPQTGVHDRAAQTAVAPAPAARPGPAPVADADIVRAAEAALKAGVETDSRITEIKRAVQAGKIRFDADLLATVILRYHGKQD